MADRSVAVLVLTFRRPALLASCLQSIATQVSVEDWEVIVIDNDDHPSASGVVQSLSGRFPVPLHYVHHPDPGLASARNRALDEALRFDVVCFIDDDESAGEGWLRNLMARLDDGADVVQGHVVSELEPGGPRWASESGVYSRRPPAAGGRDSTALSGNVAIRMSAVGPARFSRAFDFTGGEDTEFFARLARSGAVIVGEPAAIVSEAIPRSRQTLRWLFRRSMRSAAVWVRVEREHRRGKFRILRRLGSALADLTVGTFIALTLVSPSRVRRLGPIALQRCAKSAGTLGGLLGVAHREYRR